MWEELLVKCRDKGDFVSTCQMTESSFHKLVDLMASHIHVEEVKSRNYSCGTHSIDQTVIVAAGLRWLGGKPYTRAWLTFFIPFGHPPEELLQGS
jgi:hypothetical protein